MQSEIDEKKFIEYAEVHGNFYGTSYRTVEDISATGRCCILELDIQGAHQLRDSVFLFFSFSFPCVCVCMLREQTKRQSHKIRISVVVLLLLLLYWLN